MAERQTLIIMQIKIIRYLVWPPLIRNFDGRVWWTSFIWFWHISPARQFTSLAARRRNKQKRYCFSPLLPAQCCSFSFFLFPLRPLSLFTADRPFFPVRKRANSGLISFTARRAYKASTLNGGDHYAVQTSATIVKAHSWTRRNGAVLWAAI